MKHIKIHTCLIASVITACLSVYSVQAQQVELLSLQKAIELALQNNHLLNIKKLQVEEKQAKVSESRIKAFPTLIASSNYQYNQNLSSLIIPPGSLGTLPLSQEYIIGIPREELSFELNEHTNFNAGVTLYQPLTQLGKIKAGVDVSKTEVQIVDQERIKTSLQLQLAVEKLYYGLLINRQQQEEAKARLELAKMKLYDVESALTSGKTTEVNQAGLMANVADEEQNLLKLAIQSEDYIADLKNITGLTADSILLEDAGITEQTDDSDSFKCAETTGNTDLKIARLSHQKAEQAFRAARYSYLPDLGLIAGYTYQTGTILYPEHNPFIGASFKWNIQDAFLNRQLINQRNSQLQQAREYVFNTEKQLISDLDKAERKISHAKALVAVAEKVVKYRSEELKIQQDKEVSGLNTVSELLNAKSLLAKAQADYLSARMNYRIALTELRILRGK